MGFGFADYLITPEIQSAHVILYCKARLINQNEMQSLCDPLKFNALNGRIDRPPVIVSVCDVAEHEKYGILLRLCSHVPVLRKQRKYCN